MTQFPVSSSNERPIHAALGLSKNSWLLAIQSSERDNPSLYPLRGDGAEGLIAKRYAARDRVAKVNGSARANQMKNYLLVNYCMNENG